MHIILHKQGQKRRAATTSGDKQTVDLAGFKKLFALRPEFRWKRRFICMAGNIALRGVYEIFACL